MHERPEFHTWVSRALNRVLPVQSFSVDAVRSRAEGRAGLAAYGAPSALEGLSRVVDAIGRSTFINPLARRLSWVLVERMWETRLRILEAHRAQPELSGVRVARPIIIVSQARTGTTFLHGLLARDPGNRTLRRSELQMPFPAQRPGEPRALRRRKRFIVDTMKRAFITRDGLSYLDAIHPSGPNEPEECGPILMRSFLSDGFQATAPLPDYSAWLRAQSDEAWCDAYRYHRLEVQHLTQHVGGERVVLKSPLHLQALAAVHAVYPDATLVWTHREPLDYVPSLLELIATMWSIGSREVDPAWFEPLVTHIASDMCRAVTVRSTLPAASFFDVSFSTLVADPIGVVRELYASRGERLSDDAERAMTGWLRSRPKESRSRPTLEDFRLSPELVERLHRPYLDVHGHRLAR